jgi:hypothetical protein
LKVFLIVAGLVAGAGAATALALAPPGKSLLLNLSKQLYGLVGIAVAICGLCLGFRLTNKMTTAFPAELATIRGHVRWLVANNPQLLGAPPGQWSRELVAEKVRGIVIDQLGVKNYREDARFVEDLGLG